VYGRLFMSREKSGNFRGTIPLTVGIEAL